jgi:hypothetical protein
LGTISPGNFFTRELFPCGKFYSQEFFPLGRLSRAFFRGSNFERTLSRAIFAREVIREFEEKVMLEKVWSVGSLEKTPWLLIGEGCLGETLIRFVS